MTFVLARVSVVLALIAPLVLPVSAAESGSNEVEIDVEGKDNHVASCQLLVLVQPLLILALEDRLGLVTRASSRALGDVIASQVGGNTFSECSVDVGNITLRLPASFSSATFVSGPEGNGASGHSYPAGTVITRHDPGNTAAVCQHIVMVGALIVGGGAFGLPTGKSGSVVHAVTTKNPDWGSACDIDVGAVTVIFG